MTSGLSDLWRSDGTDSGTRVLRDIFPGEYPGAFQGFDAIGTELAFFADDGSFGTELWCTDGSFAGTRRVSDLVPGFRGVDNYPRSVGKLGDKGVFVVLTAAAGAELYSSDCQTLGLLTDLNPGAQDGVRYAIATGSRVVFGGNAGSAGFEPWISDGTAAGTHPLADLAAGSADSNPSDFRYDGAGTVWFTACSGADACRIYRLDVATEDLVAIVASEVDDRSKLALIDALPNGRLLAWRDNSTAGLEPISVSGNVMTSLGDLFPGPIGSGSNATHARIPGGRAVFGALVANGLRVLLASDGTPAGTERIFPPAGVQTGDVGRLVDPISFPALAGARTLFNGSLASAPYDVWQTDGTAAGTSILVPAASFLQDFGEAAAEIDGGVLLRTSGGLTFTDGTAASARLIRTLPNSSSYPSATAVGNTISGVAYVGPDFASFLCGFRPGPVLPLRSLFPPDIENDPVLYSIDDNRALINVQRPGTGMEPWLYTASTGTASPLGDLNIGPGSASVGGNAVVEGSNFVATVHLNDQVSRLLLSNGTPAGTQIHDAGCLEIPSDYPLTVVLGIRAILTCAPPANGREPWVYDFSTQTGSLLADFLPGPEPSGIRILGEHANQVVLLSQNPPALWRSDGTSAGTTQLVSLANIPDLNAPGLYGGLLDAGGFALVTVINHTGAGRDDGYTAVYAFHGTSVTLLAAASRVAYAFGAKLGNLVYFPFHDDAEGLELWATDGTPAGTHRVVPSLRPGPVSSRPEYLTAAPGYGLLFTADLGPAESRELVLWTGAAYVPIIARPGPEYGLDFLYPILVSGSRAAFVGNHPNTGWELFTVDLSGDSVFEWGME